ncbi:MAG: hypothetical protein WBX01_06420 [Nitrososphaeraceae archaeon]
MFGPLDLFGAEFFSKDEKPFGKSYDNWVEEFWNQWIGLSRQEATPKPDGCLINNQSLVMLMDPTETTRNTPIQRCSILSTQGILVPLWIGWCDTSPDGAEPKEPLSKCAREALNEGDIRSRVVVDGNPVANLNVRNSGVSGIARNSIANVTELPPPGTESPNFNLVVPADSKYNGLSTFEGYWAAGSHGFWVFLKPLSPGQHTFEYDTTVHPIGVSGGTNNVDSKISYILDVK